MCIHKNNFKSRNPEYFSEVNSEFVLLYELTVLVENFPKCIFIKHDFC